MLGEGCQVRGARKTSKPGILFFHDFVQMHLVRALSASSEEHLAEVFKVKSYCDSNGACCQNMSVYHLSERYMPDKHITRNMKSNHVSRPPEARSKVIATDNGACSNMPKHVRIRPAKHIKETEIKHRCSRPHMKQDHKCIAVATATVHALHQTCQNMSGYSLSNISVG